MLVDVASYNLLYHCSSGSYIIVWLPRCAIRVLSLGNLQLVSTVSMLISNHVDLVTTTHGMLGHLPTFESSMRSRSVF